MEQNQFGPTRPRLNKQFVPGDVKLGNFKTFRSFLYIRQL